jgi:WD40 repeat protein
VVRALDWNHRAVKCVAFDPGLGKLAGGSLDGTVSLWDATEGKLLRTFEWRRNPFEWQRSEVASVAFDPAGRLLASGSANGTVHLWDTDSGELPARLHGTGRQRRQHSVSPDQALAGQRRR